MSDINIPIELLELATGRPLEVGEQFDFNSLSKVIHQMTVVEVHPEDEEVTVEIFATNEKTYRMRLPQSYLAPARIN